MQQLSALDNGMLGLESSRTPNHLCMVNIYDVSTAPDGQVTFEDLAETIRQCLPGTPSLRRKLVRVPLGLDNPYWIEDDEFDLEFHLRQLALPRPGDWVQFRTQVSRLHSRALDMSRPPWELTMIEGLDHIAGLPAGCFAIVLKVHHAAIDGISGVELLNVMHTLSPDEPIGHFADSWHAEATPSPWELLGKAGVHALVRPVASIRQVADLALPTIKGLPKLVTDRSTRLRVPRTRFNNKVSAHRVFDEVRCPLDEMKAMKRSVDGATINDVCLTVVGGAMRHYLSDKGELPELSMVAMVPVSTRRPDQIGEGGNHVSMMRASMHTDIADPVDRLAAVRATTRQLKQAQEGIGAETLLELGQTLPGALPGLAIRAVSAVSRSGPLLANTAVTNVPGSPVPQYFHGAKIVKSTGCVPVSDG
ncbi:MAG: wax ester/triacylglycerol synthase family O-acyltransferase, partial [Acidimicrobiia bacterium]